MSAQVRATPAVNVELPMLQGLQEPLPRWIEEIQPFDAVLSVSLYAGLTQALQIALARAGVIQTAQKAQITLVAPPQSRADRSGCRSTF